MFLKPFRVKSNSSLKSSDRKKLKQDVVSRNPGLSEEDADRLIPHKADVSVSKIQTQAHGVVSVHLVDGVPLFFSPAKDKSGDGLLPTVYALWKCPVLAPRPLFHVHGVIVKKLQNGADLMIPGIVLPKGVDGFGMKTFGEFKRGQPCSVATADNGAVAAVGTMAVDNLDFYMSAGRGKGVLITHVVGDHLWEMGPKTLRPEFGPPADLSVDSSENPEEDDEEGKEGSSESEQEVEDDELARNVEKMDVGGGDADAKSSDADRTTSPDREEEQQQQQTKNEASADEEELLMHCLLKALKTTAKKAELPLLTSNFYRLHVLPACPDGRQVDVRKSRYKKLSVFLKEAAALYPGLLKIEETAKGVESIVAVDYGHDALRSFTFDPSETTALPPSPEATKDASRLGLKYDPPEIVELHSVTAAVLPLLRGRSKGDALTTAEVRDGLLNYVKSNELNSGPDKRLIGLDPVLASVVLKKGENDVIAMPWAEVISRTLQKMTPAYKLAFQNQEPVVKKGAVPSLGFALVNRAGNKKVTVITGVTEFGLDIHQVSKCIQVGVATSASVGTGADGREQVTVMGDQRKFLFKLFVEDLKMPKKYLKGLDAAAINKAGRKK